MKKGIIILLVFLGLAGCTSNNQYYNKNIDYNILIGNWNNVTFGDNVMAVSTITFYNDYKCSQAYDLSVGYEIRSLINEPCHYHINGNNITVQFDDVTKGEGVFEYVEDEQAIYYIQDGLRESRYVKINDDPCSRVNNFCD